MAIRVKCPGGHVFSCSEADKGKRIPCPVCEQSTVISGSQNTSPKKRKREAAVPSRKYHPYWRIRLGLGFHFALILFYLIALDLLFFAAYTGGRSAIFGVVLLYLLGFLRPVLSVIGSILCRRVPSSSRGRSWLLASGSLEIAQLTVGITSLVLGRLLRDRMESGGFVLLLAGAGVSYLMAYASWLCLMVFLERLNRFLEQVGDASETAGLIFLGSIVLLSPLIIVPIVTYLIVRHERLMADGYNVFVYAGALTWTVFAATIFIRILQLLSRTRDALKREIDRS